MAFLNKTLKIYYHIITGSPYLLADEIHKKRLLDAVQQVQDEVKWRILAFCIMDEAAYFIIETEGSDQLIFGTRKIMDRFLMKCQKQLPAEDAGEVSMEIGASRALCTWTEILCCSRNLHRMPLRRGYVQKISDYWWSSYITYQGIYDWEFVDCRMMCLYFSADPETGVREFVKYHDLPDD